MNQKETRPRGFRKTASFLLISSTLLFSAGLIFWRSIDADVGALVTIVWMSMIITSSTSVIVGITQWRAKHTRIRDLFLTVGIWGLVHAVYIMPRLAQAR